MVAILTSSLGGSHGVGGKRHPTFLLNDNALYGEAYRIKDGRQEQICRQGEALLL